MKKITPILSLATLLMSTSVSGDVVWWRASSQKDDCFITDNSYVSANKGFDNYKKGELEAAVSCYSAAAEKEFEIHKEGYQRVSNLIQKVWKLGTPFYGYPFEEGAEEELELGNLNSAASLYELAAWDYFLNLSNYQNSPNLEHDTESLKYFLLSATLNKEPLQQIKTLYFGKQVADYALKDHHNPRILILSDRLDSMFVKVRKKLLSEGIDYVKKLFL